MFPLTCLTPQRSQDYRRYVAMTDAKSQLISLADVADIQEQIMLHEGTDVVYYTGLYGGELLRAPERDVWALIQTMT